jgi:hypothetical protein
VAHFCVQIVSRLFSSTFSLLPYFSIIIYCIIKKIGLIKPPIIVAVVVVPLSIFGLSILKSSGHGHHRNSGNWVGRGCIFLPVVLLLFSSLNLDKYAKCFLCCQFIPVSSLLLLVLFLSLCEHEIVDQFFVRLERINARDAEKYVCGL